jgi:hypothetical protein
MTLAAVILASDAYAAYWPRAWSELAGQVATGAPVGEVVIARPPGSGPSLARLGDAFKAAAGREPPRLREHPMPDPDPVVGTVRNAALDLVDAQLVVFMDVDDRIAPGLWGQLSSLHQGQPGLGTAAATTLRWFPDGAVLPLGAPAHRLRRPRRFSPRSAWQQALLWRLSIEAAVLTPAAGAVHSTRVVRACGGFGRLAMDDLVLGAASVSCAPACYLPRLAGRLWEQRSGSWWSRDHPRQEILDAHDEMAERLGELAARGRLRPGLARGWALAKRILSRRRRHLERTLPSEGIRLDADRSPPASMPLGPELRGWLTAADRSERRMAELLDSA